MRGWAGEFPLEELHLAFNLFGHAPAFGPKHLELRVHKVLQRKKKSLLLRINIERMLMSDISRSIVQMI